MIVLVEVVWMLDGLIDGQFEKQIKTSEHSLGAKHSLASVMPVQLSHRAFSRQNPKHSRRCKI
ncbi:hypothetical protein H8957_000304 [Semnopithecus entellus]|uniref:Testis cDNA clone: QtsA-13742, similar to human constitutive photomorphogenic protein (COP1) n=1 Tax=Macaca fascicularis TaxID=9541 RepID=Q4R818_MACFA|nr:unnamed protein product [Macaca fascicularis]